MLVVGEQCLSEKEYVLDRRKQYVFEKADLADVVEDAPLLWNSTLEFKVCVGDTM